jgi:hypothetical protein
MEAVVIKIHGRDVAKLVNPASLKEVKDTLSPHWQKQLVELGKKHQSDYLHGKEIY